MNITLSEEEKQLVFAAREADWGKAKQLIELTRDREMAKLAEAEAKKRREEIETQLATLTGKVAPPKDFKGRTIRLRVTEGSLKHSYLLVTRALDDGMLKETETLEVYVPATGESFRTDIYVRNKHLNERR